MLSRCNAPSAVDCARLLLASLLASVMAQCSSQSALAQTDAPPDGTRDDQAEVGQLSRQQNSMLQPIADTARAEPAGQSAPVCNAAVPDIAAGLFNSQAIDDNDPVEPFTLYGTVFKKFFIENLEGQKIVSRKRGFTTTACTAAVAAAKETPEFQFLSLGEKMQQSGKRQCVKAETQEMSSGCGQACPSSCSTSLQSYLLDYRSATGYSLDDKSYNKLLSSCTRRCNKECSKGGAGAYDYVISYRRY